MAEAFEAELRITGVSEATQELEGLSSQLGTTSDGVESTGLRFTEMKSQIDLALAAVRTITTAVTTFGAEMERQTGIMNRFTGNVDLAAQKTNGLYTQMQLIVAQNRTMQAGLHLTERQFAALAVASNEFAAATGTGNVEAMDRLTQAINSGSTEAFRALGINVEGVTGLANIQAEAIRQLEAKYGDAESQIDSAAGAMQVISNRMTDFNDELLVTIGRSSSLKRTMDELTSAFSSADDELGGFTEGPLSDAQALGIGMVAVFNAVATTVRQAASAVLNAFRIIGDVASMRFSSLDDDIAALRENFEGIGNVAHQFREDIASGALQTSASENGQNAANGSTGGNAARASAAGAGRGQGSDQNRFATLLAANAQTEQQLLDSISEQMSNIGDIENEFMNAKMRELEISDKLLLNEKAQFEATQEKIDAVERFQDRQQKGVDTALQFTGILADATEKAVKGEAKFGTAVKQTLKEWLGGFAKRQALMGAEDLAIAIAKTIANPPDAAAHYLGAAQHFALAAAAGGGAAAIPSGGSASGGGGGARPDSQGSSGGGGGGGTVVINVNTPTPEADIGRTIDSASRAARARDGSGRGL